MPDFSSAPFPQSLRELMEQRGLSYRQLSYKTKLSAGYLNHLSKGTRPAPSKEVLERIALALHVEPAYFREYRLRYVTECLSASPDLLSQVYLLCSNGHLDGPTTIVSPSYARQASAESLLKPDPKPTDTKRITGEGHQR